MAKINCYVITCSSDNEMDIRSLYVWGEWGSARWLPTTKKEAQRRVEECRKKTACEFCDAQIHKIYIERNRNTYMQEMLNKDIFYKKGKKSATRVRKQCEFCGKIFYVFPSQSLRKYCSIACYAQARKN